MLYHCNACSSCIFLDNFETHKSKVCLKVCVKINQKINACRVRQRDTDTKAERQKDRKTIDTKAERQKDRET